MVNLDTVISQLIPIIVFFAILAICGVIIWYNNQKSASGTEQVITLVDPEKAAADAEFLEHLQNNKKINAIKRHRELTGVGLKEAKDSVEYLQRNPDALVNKRASRLSGEAAGTPFDAGIRELIRQNKSHEAIKVYQDFTGASLSEAAVEIERISWEMDEREKRSGEDAL